jgi:hypothetical protein
MNQSESINELTAALVKAQLKIKGAHKDSENPYFKSKYADLNSTWDACRDALLNNGLSVIQTLNGSNLETTLAHISGQWIKGSCPLLNLKGDMQGLGSAISYARRYSLAAMVGVVAEDDDAEGAGTVRGDLKSPSDIKSPRPSPEIPELKNPGDYIPQVKKFKDKFPGKSLSQIGDYEVLTYLTWLTGNTELKFVEQKEFVKYAKAYLEGLKSKTPPPNDDIPWPEGRMK